MPETKDSEAGEGRSGALAALLEVASDPSITKEFQTAAASFDESDYEQLIALAWRYQFDPDRLKFKRGIHELQEHVSQKILARLELGE